MRLPGLLPQADLTERATLEAVIKRSRQRIEGLEYGLRMLEDMLAKLPEGAAVPAAPPTWDGVIRVTGEGPCNLLVGRKPCGVVGEHVHGSAPLAGEAEEPREPHLLNLSGAEPAPEPALIEHQFIAGVFMSDLCSVSTLGVGMCAKPRSAHRVAQ